MNSTTLSNKELMRTHYGQEGIVLCDTGDTKMNKTVIVLEELTIQQKHTNYNKKQNKASAKRYKISGKELPTTSL